MTPSRVLLNHEPKLYYGERISLRDFVARFNDAVASEDKCAADDLKYNWRIQDDGAYRIGYLMVFHGVQSTREEQQTFRDKSEPKL